MNSSKQKEPVDCLVVGAGMAGIMAARRVHEHDLTPVLFERESEVGGRVQTRRIDNAVFDTGAQYLTLRSQEFKQALQPLLSGGDLVEWSRGFPTVGGRREHRVHPRYIHPGGMVEVPRRLSQKLRLRFDAPIGAISRRGDGWEVTTPSGSHRGRGLVLTPPVPQSKTLLETGSIEVDPDTEQMLSQLLYDPCLALLVVLEGPSEVPEPGGVQIRHGPLRWIADNQQKGISPDQPCLTILADASFSREHHQDPDREVAGKMLEAAGSWLGSEVRRWEFLHWPESEPIVFPDHDFLALSDQPPLILAGDTFSSARVEGAAESGLSAGNRVAALLKGGV